VFGDQSRREIVLRSARRYSQNAYATAEPRVEGMTREEATIAFQKKIILLARQIGERLPSDSSLCVEDLVSYGAIGLLEAFDRYDEARGILFSTFAEYRIRGAMLDALRSTDTFTRRRRQLSKKISAASKSLRFELGREPTPGETAKRLGISIDEYWDSVDRVKPVSLISLDGVLVNGDSEESRTLAEQLSTSEVDDPSRRLDAIEIKSHLQNAILGLPEKERHCVMMYYGRDLSLAEVAAVYGVSVSRISQIITQAKGKLRKKLHSVIDHGDLHVELD